LPRTPASTCRQIVGKLPTGKPRKCSEIGNRSGYCPAHYAQWRRLALRCDFPSCMKIITYPGNGPKAERIDGRRMVWPDRKSYALCREHEVLHLRLTPETEAINLARLGRNLEAGGPRGDCWIWKIGKGQHNDDGYPLMDPEGSNGDDWYVHRIAWNLLNSTGRGHGQRQVLAHRCDVRACANPAHLDPSTKVANARHKKLKPRGPSRKYWGATAHNFAVAHGLPNPFPLVDMDNPYVLGPVPAPDRQYGWPLVA
jgi:hypothetical protein